MFVEANFLLIPQKYQHNKVKLIFSLDQTVCRYVVVEFCEPEEADFWGVVDLRPWKGKELEFSSTADIDTTWMRWSKTMPKPEPTDRPAWHFVAAKGWLNDPNGLIYYKGTWHLFYQHNAYGRIWGNMSWGHAVSKNLFQWEHEEETLWPDETGTMFSGSAILDEQNMFELQQGEDPAIILYYTAAGENAPLPIKSTQRCAASQDGGKTWFKIEGEAIVPNIFGHNRDPKVIWHEEKKHWVMPLFLDYDEAHAINRRSTFAILVSSDMKHWRETQRLDWFGRGECPDLFELKNESSGESYWVFWSADGCHRLGKFDGEIFSPETLLNNAYDGGSPQNSHLYAAQTYNHEPKGRRVQITWMSGPMLNNSIYNQQMSLPVELKLRTIRQRPTVVFCCLEEFYALLSPPKTLNPQKPQQLGPGPQYLKLHLKMEHDGEMEFSCAGLQWSLHRKKHTLKIGDQVSVIEWEDDQQDLDIEIVLDLHSVECFANGGQLYSALALVDAQKEGSFSLKSCKNSAITSLLQRTPNSQQS